MINKQISKKMHVVNAFGWRFGLVKHVALDHRSYSMLGPVST